MILITEPMDDAWVDWLRARAEVEYHPDLSDFPEELAERAQLAQALIVGPRTEISGDLLYAGFSCVGVMGLDAGGVDAPDCAGHDITVVLATGAAALALAEAVVTAGAALLGGDVTGKTLGLIGYDETARAVAARAGALGMTVLASDPEADEFPGAMEGTEDEVLTTSDVLSLHCPLSEAATEEVGAAVIATMKRGAVLIDVAPGGLAKTAEVVAALDAGHLGGAALAAKAGVADAPNLILVPDIGADPQALHPHLSEVTARNVAAHLGLD